MHECPDCGEACYCDMEDHHTGELCDFDCVHQCDPAFDDEDEWDEAENEWVRDCGTPGCIHAAMFNLHTRDDCYSPAMQEAYDRYIRFEGVNRRQVLV